MASASLLTGLIKFLKREDWREAFQTVLDAHLLVACCNAGIETEDLDAILGPEAAMNLWGCAFEDFLARDLPEGRNVVDDYLKRRGYKESASAKAYMKAIRTSVMSLYEVSEIEPGRSFLARDLIRGGDPVRVTERTASAMLNPWDRIGARIVALGGGHQLCGGLLHYDFETAEKVMAKFRWFERRVEKEMHVIAREIGGTFDASRFTALTAHGELLEQAAPIFTRLWLTDALDKALNPHPLRLVNTEGEDIVLCTLRFPLADGADAAAVDARLEGLPGMNRESDTFFNWLLPNGPDQSAAASADSGIVMMSTHSSGGTVLGSIEIKSREVVVMTNSRQRAERARSLIGTRLQPFVGTSRLEVETIEDARTRRQTPKRESARLPVMAIPADERHRVTHAFLDEHYRKTLDRPIASLGNRSPREAIRTAEGRDQVVTWLKYLENGSRRGRDPDDPIATYKFDWMWEELGCAALRRLQYPAAARAKA